MPSEPISNEERAPSEQVRFVSWRLWLERSEKLRLSRRAKPRPAYRAGWRNIAAQLLRLLEGSTAWVAGCAGVAAVSSVLATLEQSPSKGATVVLGDLGTAVGAHLFAISWLRLAVSGADADVAVGDAASAGEASAHADRLPGVHVHSRRAGGRADRVQAGAEGSPDGAARRALRHAGSVYHTDEHKATHREIVEMDFFTGTLSFVVGWGYIGARAAAALAAVSVRPAERARLPSPKLAFTPSAPAALHLDLS